MNKKYFCKQCKKEVEILEENIDESGHLFKVLGCGHETAHEVKVGDSGKGEDKNKVDRLWDSLSITFISILISVGLTIGFGIGGLTKNLYLGILGFILGLFFTALVLKYFKNFLIKYVSWIWK